MENLLWLEEEGIFEGGNIWTGLWVKFEFQGVRRIEEMVLEGTTLTWGLLQSGDLGLRRKQVVQFNWIISWIQGNNERKIDWWKIIEVLEYETEWVCFVDLEEILGIVIKQKWGCCQDLVLSFISSTYYLNASGKLETFSENWFLQL